MLYQKTHALPCFEDGVGVLWVYENLLSASRNGAAPGAGLSFLISGHLRLFWKVGSVLEIMFQLIQPKIPGVTEPPLWYLSTASLLPCFFNAEPG